MTPGRRNTLILTAVAGAALGAGMLAGPAIFSRGSDEAGLLRRGRFLDLQGRPRTLSEWKGTVLVVNFWATWCAPCLEEIPMLMAARKSYASFGVEIVGIGIDLTSKIREFSLKLAIDYPILVAETDALELMRKLGNASAGLPYTVFLDRNAIPVERKLGALKQPELERILGALVQK